MATTFMEYPTWNPGFMREKRRRGSRQIRVTYLFPELVHVNFNIIVGKSFGPCLFCTVVQFLNFSMDHVIDALAADIIITRTQTINRAWNFESLENMV